MTEGARAVFGRAGRAARDDEHPERVRGRRLRRWPEPAEEDGGRRRGARSGPHPGHVGALPRVHLDAEGRARPARDRELRDARARRPRAERLFPLGHEHARLAHLREPRGVVPQLRFRRARDDDLQPRAEGEAGDADGSAGSRGHRRFRTRSPETSIASARSGTARRSRRRSRLQRDVVAADGTVYKKGTAIPQRADFNTLDNPFFWSASPERDAQQDEPAAGVHFVVFNPTSDDFHRNRLAMDGVLPDGTQLPLEPRRPRPGPELGAPGDPPPELPRAAAQPALVSARRVAE